MLDPSYDLVSLNNQRDVGLTSKGRSYLVHIKVSVLLNDVKSRHPGNLEQISET